MQIVFHVLIRSQQIIAGLKIPRPSIYVPFYNIAKRKITCQKILLDNKNDLIFQNHFLPFYYMVQKALHSCIALHFWIFSTLSLLISVQPEDSLRKDYLMNLDEKDQ